MLYLDAVEYYSEKLVSIQLSHQIAAIMQRFVKELNLGKQIAKKLGFKICKNLPSLLDAFKSLKQTISDLVEANYDKCEQIVLLQDICFYIVIDNIKVLLETERQKKVVTKLAILEQMLTS